MRLLNVRLMKLEEYFGYEIPEYAILSHCWGPGEVSFQDMNGNQWDEMLGADKIRLASQYCQADAVDHIWIDTCCINKTSSAELSEAINSMYSWYENAARCYVYLVDVTQPLILDYMQTLDDRIGNSRWFTRGWTLQELIAPKVVRFFDKNWRCLGTKEMLSSLISSITNIPKAILIDPSQCHASSVARKMSWASRRKTTRIEDTAYSLLGIFGVNMPLLYGEGSRAFIRLQEEIMKETDDQSLFAWGFNQGNTVQKRNWGAVNSRLVGVLAESPADFVFSANIVPYPSSPEI